MGQIHSYHVIQKQNLNRNCKSVGKVGSLQNETLWANLIYLTQDFLVDFHSAQYYYLSVLFPLRFKLKYQLLSATIYLFYLFPFFSYIFGPITDATSHEIDTLKQILLFFMHLKLCFSFKFKHIVTYAYYTFACYYMYITDLKIKANTIFWSYS